MTFNSAIGSLRDGQAAKLTSWGGYVSRVDAQKTDAFKSKYVLKFQERSDKDSDGTQSYEFTFTVNNDDSVTVAEPSKPLKMDSALLQALLSSDWITGSADSFESARTGTTRW